MADNTPPTNPLLRAQSARDQVQAEQTTAMAAHVETLKAKCGEQLECIELILAWVRQYNLSKNSHGYRYFELEPMCIPDAEGHTDYFNKYTLNFTLNTGFMCWYYYSGTMSSSVSFNIYPDRPGFWEALARVTPNLFLRALEKTAKRERVPMPF